MPPADLLLRTRAFSLAVLEFCRTLPHTDEAREEAGQLRRAANGLRSNYRAARKGRSRKEFAAKLGTASEEATDSILQQLGIRESWHQRVKTLESLGPAIQRADQRELEITRKTSECEPVCRTSYQETTLASCC